MSGLNISPEQEHWEERYPGDQRDYRQNTRIKRALGAPQS